MDKEVRTKIAGNAGKNAHALGRAHKWTKEEASKAGKLGGGRPRGTKPLSEKMLPNSTRSRLLTRLQHSLAEALPGTPVSFATLAQEMGVSRQYLRTPYLSSNTYIRYRRSARRVGAVKSK